VILSDPTSERSGDSHGVRKAFLSFAIVASVNLGMFLRRVRGLRCLHRSQVVCAADNGVVIGISFGGYGRIKRRFIADFAILAESSRFPVPEEEDAVLFERSILSFFSPRRFLLFSSQISYRGDEEEGPRRKP